MIERDADRESRRAFAECQRRRVREAGEEIAKTKINRVETKINRVGDFF